MDKKFRLVTRSDMDGLVCAVLLKYMDLIDQIDFVHPRDMQDGKIPIGDRDITTNLPYVNGVHLAFDHHFSETIRNEKRDNHIIEPDAPSAARVVYNYYGGSKKFPEQFNPMMEAVDKADSAAFTTDDVLDPRGWVLLSFLMDARTGLGRFREFRVSNYSLMMDLIDYCTHHSIDEILNHPDVKERVDLYKKYENEFKEQIQRCSSVHDKLLILDLRNEDIIFPGNRFMIYAMFPQTNVSIHILQGFQNQNTVFATGKSIFDKGCPVNIGELMLQYGGGGHSAAGTCQIEHDLAEKVREELIAKLSNP